MKISTRAILSGLMLAGTIVAASPARAADITFDISAVVTNIPHTSIYYNDPVTGTLKINTVTGTVDAADILVAGFEFTSVGTTTCGISPFTDHCISVFTNPFSSNYGEIDYGSSLIGYAGGTLGPQSFMYLGSVAYTITGTATSEATKQSTTVTPEPSSLALLGTGMFGLVGLVRRKLSARS